MIKIKVQGPLGQTRMLSAVGIVPIEVRPVMGNLLSTHGGKVDRAAQFPAHLLPTGHPLLSASAPTHAPPITHRLLHAYLLPLPLNVNGTAHYEHPLSCERLLMTPPGVFTGIWYRSISTGACLIYKNDPSVPVPDLAVVPLLSSLIPPGRRVRTGSYRG